VILYPVGSAARRFDQALDGIFGSQLKADWDPMRGIAIATGVSSWTDRVSSIAAIQPTGGFQPAYNAGGLDGHGELVFDGVDDRLVSGMVSGLSGMPGTLLMIGSRVSGTAGRSFLLAEGGATGSHLIYWNGSNWAGYATNAAGTQGIRTDGAVDTSPHIFASRLQSAVSSDLIIDGAQFTAGTSVTGNILATATNFWMGSNSTGLVYGNLKISRGLYITGDVSNAQMNALGAAARLRWPSLPTWSALP
jgi:hypothetical protein